jgi:hypothetical protein
MRNSPVRDKNINSINLSPIKIKQFKNHTRNMSVTNHNTQANPMGGYVNSMNSKAYSGGFGNKISAIYQNPKGGINKKSFMSNQNSNM